MALQLLNNLSQHGRLRPDTVAVREVVRDAPSRMLTWGQLSRLVDHWGAVFASALKPGDVGIICSPNTCDFWVSFLGMLKAGLNVFPVWSDIAEMELLSAAERTGAAAIVGGARARATLQRQARLAVALEDVCAIPAAGAAVRPGTLTDASEQAGLLLLSSGTTSQPKIVQRTALSLDRLAMNICRAIGFAPTDRVLATVPLCHAYGLDHGLLAPVWCGCTVHLSRGLDMQTVLRELASPGITHLPAVPAVFEMLAQIVEPGTRFPSIRAAYTAGATLPRTIHDAMIEKCGLVVSQLYGTSEFGSITFSDPRLPAFDPASVGLPMDGVIARITNPGTPDGLAPPDAEGPLLIASPTMMTGYWGQSASPVQDGFWDTGDLGRIDRHGNLTITGRIKLLIDIDGRKVNPLEVEEVLRQHPAVGDACVVPLWLSETICRLRAVVTPRTPGTVPVEDELRQFCRTQLSAYKVPRVFEVRPSLPRSPGGKVARRQLEQS